MKTLAVILLLPIMLLAQPQGQQYKETLDMDLALGVDIASVIKTIPIPESPDDANKMIITVEIYIEEVWIETVSTPIDSSEKAVGILPRYLSTFSVLALHPAKHENNAPQQRLDRLLALNDPSFPKENTLFQWLNPVRYAENRFGGTENALQGFGPQVRL